jgi:hypothetical protein
VRGWTSAASLNASVHHALFVCLPACLATFSRQEDMAKHQEAAYERLFKWVQQQCTTLAQDAPEFDSGDRDVQPLLRAALKVLAARPSYLRSARTRISSHETLSFVDVRCIAYNRNTTPPHTHTPHTPP